MALYTFSLLLFVCTAVASSSFRGNRQLEESLSDRIKKAIPLVQKHLNLIYHRYEMSTDLGKHMVYGITQLSPESWELQREIFINKMVTKNSQYKMIFGGSSVTAGHDNGPRQSYVYVWEDRMKPVFEALGINLVVNNIAQGANDCIPSNLCYESMGGENADFISWEQSFNCGRDSKMFELSSRWAILEKGYGSIYFAESGGWNPSPCPESTDPTPYSSPDWTPESVHLPYWEATPAEVDNYKSIQADYKPYTSARFSGDIDKYPKAKKQFAVSGFSFWNRYKHPKIEVEEVIPEKERATMHTAAPAHILVACKLKAFTKEASVFGSVKGTGAKWHPARAIHQFRGEMLTWLYGMVLLDAMYHVEKEIAASSEAAVVARYSDIVKNFGLATPKDIPPPSKCGDYCVTKPQCYTDYRPHYNPKMMLDEIIVGATNWTRTTLADFTPPDTSFVEMRTGYHAVQGVVDGEIHFKVTVHTEKPQVLVCGYHLKESFEALEFTMDMNVPDARLEAYTPASNRYPWVARKVSTVCGMLENLPPGQHVLSMRSKEGATRLSASVSHIVMW